MLLHGCERPFEVFKCSQRKGRAESSVSQALHLHQLTTHDALGFIYMSIGICEPLNLSVAI